MQLHKLLLSTFIISTIANAKIHFDVALLRGTNLTFQNAVMLTVGQKPAKVYQDETTYIEAELVSEAEDMPHVKLTVSTKSDHGMFLVRGMPEVVANIASGLSMSSVQCNSANDNFALLVAMAKTE